MPACVQRVRAYRAGCLAVTLSLSMLASAAQAQVVVTPRPEDPTPRAAIFQRAQRLVNDGFGSEGRALVDSLLNATAPRSADEAEVLFWRATIAENWDQAQRDYMRVMLEHERSPFAPRAMLRLAQGELMRADTVASLRYLERSLLEWPEYEDAKTMRDRLVATRAVAAAPADSTRTPSAASSVPSSGAAAPRAPSAPSAGATVASGAMAWTVQIAAFPTAEEAATFAAEIRERGYDTRVDGVAAPFRVRFGYYATRGGAAAAMEAYKLNERGDAFLAQVRRP
jgi:septal ring-binding cell division protein DamX